MTTELLEQEVSELSADSDVQRLLAVRDKAHWLKDFGKLMADTADDVLLAHILTTGKPISVGDNLFVSAAYRKEVKCNNPKALLDVLLKRTGGDLDAVTACLSSSAWKHGACREPLGDTFDQHFTTTSVPYLKEGEPTKKLSVINKRFI